MSHHDVIRAPVITEKATLLGEHNQLVFEVATNADKPTIKAAIEALFDVKVKTVNTLNRRGKVKRFRGVRGVQKGVKHAIITLEEGHHIDITTGL